MYELEMNGQMVKFNFGMGFLREINKTVTVPVDGMKDMKQNVGLRYTVGRLNDYDIEALVEVLFMVHGMVLVMYGQGFQG